MEFSNFMLVSRPCIYKIRYSDHIWLRDNQSVAATEVFLYVLWKDEKFINLICLASCLSSFFSHLFLYVFCIFFFQSQAKTDDKTTILYYLLVESWGRAMVNDLSEISMIGLQKIMLLFYENYFE